MLGSGVASRADKLTSTMTGGATAPLAKLYRRYIQSSQQKCRPVRSAYRIGHALQHMERNEPIRISMITNQINPIYTKIASNRNKRDRVVHW